MSSHTQHGPSLVLLATPLCDVASDAKIHDCVVFVRKGVWVQATDDHEAVTVIDFLGHRSECFSKFAEWEVVTIDFISVESLFWTEVSHNTRNELYVTDGYC